MVWRQWTASPLQHPGNHYHCTRNDFELSECHKLWQWFQGKNWPVRSVNGFSFSSASLGWQWSTDEMGLLLLLCFSLRCSCCCLLKAGPPLDLSFWSFLPFLHHGIEEVERHLLWNFYKKIRRKSWSNVPPKLVACIGFLYKVVHKIGRPRKFNHARGI